MSGFHITAHNICNGKRKEKLKIIIKNGKLRFECTSNISLCWNVYHLVTIWCDVPWIQKTTKSQSTKKHSTKLPKWCRYKINMLLYLHFRKHGHKIVWVKNFAQNLQCVINVSWQPWSYNRNVTGSIVARDLRCMTCLLPVPPFPVSSLLYATESSLALPDLPPQRCIGGSG